MALMDVKVTARPSLRAARHGPRQLLLMRWSSADAPGPRVGPESWCQCWDRARFATWCREQGSGI